jgi:hypothetical protein
VTDRTPPQPPPGITPTPRPDIEAVAGITHEIIRAARLTGLAVPSHYSGHDYGPPTITMQLDSGTPLIWEQLQAWAVLFSGELTTRPATDPAAVCAVTEFRRRGIRVEVSAVIKHPPGHDDDGQPSQQEEGRA